MRLPVAFRREARDEMDEVYGWYQRQREGLGEEFLTEVREVLERIRSNPEHYARRYRNVRRAMTHRFPYGVHYRIDKNRIIVIAVFHSRQDPRKWQRRA
jgi:plasmid stabilization system protein ParE